MIFSYPVLTVASLCLAPWVPRDGSPAVLVACVGHRKGHGRFQQKVQEGGGEILKKNTVGRIEEEQFTFRKTAQECVGGLVS